MAQQYNVYNEEVRDDTPSLFWPLNDGIGTEPVEEEEENLDGALPSGATGETKTPTLRTNLDKAMYGALFDPAEDDAYHCVDTAALPSGLQSMGNGTRHLSVEAVIQVESGQSATAGTGMYVGHTVVCVKQAGSTVSPCNFGISSGKVEFRYGSAGSATAISTSTIDDGNMHHICYTQNGSTGAWAIYIDGGTADASGTHSTPPDGSMGTNDCDVTIGCAADNAGALHFYEFSGSIVGIAIYDNIELSQSDVTSHYNASFQYGDAPDSEIEVISVAPIPSFTRSLSDSIAVTSTSAFDVINSLFSAIGIDSSSLSTITSGNTLESEIEILSESISEWIKELTTTIPFDDSFTLVLSKLSEISSSIGLDSEAIAALNHIIAASSDIGITSLVNRFYLNAIDSEIPIVSAIEYSVTLLNALSSNIPLTSTSVSEKVLLRTLESSIGSGDDITTILTAGESVSSPILFVGSFFIQEAEYLAVVMNIANRGITEYTNYKFNSYGKWQNSYYGAADDGIYLLEGDDDEGTDIASEIQTGMMDFNITNQKVIPECYLGYTSDGNLIIKLYHQEQGDKQEIWYELLQTKDTPDTDRYTLARGARGRWFQFELVNKSSSDFELETIEFFPVILSRRIR